MSINQEFVAAQVILSDAGDLDASGCYEEALLMYRQGLDKLFEILKMEVPDEIRVSLRKKMEHYLGRAEQLKLQLEEMKAAGRPNSTFDLSGGKSDSLDYTAGRLPSAAKLKKPAAVPSSASKPAATASVSSESKNSYEELILHEMLDTSPQVHWDDIAGLAYAKQTLQEAVILPNLRPDLFTGLLTPPKGVLLFGPPGTGKTMLAKAVASEADFSFFNVSASSVTSKFLGEGEKMIRALFSVARSHQPAVIFLDEIDSLLSARGGNSEHEASRRIKTEFLVQMDGVGSSSSDRILVMGATNLPSSLDDAVIRRLVKRIYIPLPDEETRSSLLNIIMKKGNINLVSREFRTLISNLAGYSCSDITAVCKEAAMGPIREIEPSRLKTLRLDSLRPVSMNDFAEALTRIRPSLSEASLRQYEDWNSEFGTRS